MHWESMDLALAEFNVEFQYKAGKHNVVAGAYPITSKTLANGL